MDINVLSSLRIIRQVLVLMEINLIHIEQRTQIINYHYMNNDLQ